MDGLTRLYTQTVRLRIEPEQLAVIRWYWSPPGAQPFPRPHAFGSSGWETRARRYPHAGIGEVFLPRNFVPDKPPPGETGQATRTPLEWFSTGVPAWVSGPWPNGQCGQLAGVGWAPRSAQWGGARLAAAGGTGFGLAAVQLWAPASHYEQWAAAGAGWGPASAQIAAALEVGQVGAGWGPAAAQIAAALQAGAVGAGWTPSSRQGVPSVLVTTAGAGWGPASSQIAAALEVGQLGAGWGPAAAQIAAALQAGGLGAGWALSGVQSGASHTRGAMGTGWAPAALQSAYLPPTVTIYVHTGALGAGWTLTTWGGEMAARVSQVAAEVWACESPAALVAQVAAEVWAVEDPRARVSQVVVEVWVSEDLRAKVAQVVVEVWAQAP